MLWVLSQLQAPTWAFVIAWVALVFSFFQFCKELVKLGKKLND